MWEARGPQSLREGAQTCLPGSVWDSKAKVLRRVYLAPCGDSKTEAPALLGWDWLEATHSGFLRPRPGSWESEARPALLPTKDSWGHQKEGGRSPSRSNSTDHLSNHGP